MILENNNVCFSLPKISAKKIFLRKQHGDADPGLKVGFVLAFSDQIKVIKIKCKLFDQRKLFVQEARRPTSVTSVAMQRSLYLLLI